MAAGLLALGAALASQGVNFAATSSMNRRTRKWNEHIMNVQRQWALDDWAMQNAYDHPKAQMERFAAAGLNPNLIYGQTSDGSVIRPVNADAWRPDAPQVDPSLVQNSMLSYADLELKSAQADNIRANTQVAVQEAVNKALDAAGKKVSNEQGAFNLELAKDMRNYSLEAARESLRKMMVETTVTSARNEREERLQPLNIEKLKADTKYTLDENERRAALQAPSVAKAFEEVLQIRQNRARSNEEIHSIKLQQHLLQQEGVLKQLEINLKKTGLQPSDPVYYRVGLRLLEGIADQLQDKR